MADSEREAPSACKRLKQDTIFEKFKTDFKDLGRLKSAYKSLCFDRRNPLIAQEIISCNAATGYGISFSRASCETRPYTQEIYPFGSIFTDGIELLNDFFTKTDYVPDNMTFRLLLAKLIHFLMDEKSHAAIRKIQRTDVSETELMIILAEHFFSRLSLSNTYSMDHFAKYKGNLLCKCGSCKPESLAANFDDTSIGNRDCWHGSLDILLGSTESFIHVASVEEELSPGEIAPFEVKLKNVEERRFRSQTLAQVIAFSFLQKASHPSLENFLIPCMAATKKELKIYFYDCKYDILLESRGIPLLVEIPGSNSQPLNFEAIIAAWLVLNYKYLCSGPFDSLLKAPKANFFKHAEPCLEIYEKELLYQHVGEQTTILDYGFLDITKPKFVWPSNLSCKPVDSENEY